VDSLSSIVYLACPYSHPSRDVRLERFRQANLAAGFLHQQGEVVYSPISHTHPIAEVCALPLDWAYWGKVDTVFVTLSHAFCVLKIDGWDTSTGVLREMDIATGAGKPISFLIPRLDGGYDRESVT
jgi:hypothetical protein